MFACTAVDVGLDLSERRSSCAAALLAVIDSDAELRQAFEEVLTGSSRRSAALRDSQLRIWRALRKAAAQAAETGSEAIEAAPRRAVLRIPEDWWTEQERLMEDIARALGAERGRMELLRWRARMRQSAFPDVLPRVDLDERLSREPQAVELTGEPETARVVQEYLQRRDEAHRSLIEASRNMLMRIRQRGTPAATIDASVQRFEAAGTALEELEARTALRLADAVAERNAAMAQTLRDIASRVQNESWEGWRLLASMTRNQLEARRGLHATQGPADGPDSDDEHASEGSEHSDGAPAEP